MMTRLKLLHYNFCGWFVYLHRYLGQLDYLLLLLHLRDSLLSHSDWFVAAAGQMPDLTDYVSGGCRRHSLTVLLLKLLLSHSLPPRLQRLRALLRRQRPQPKQLWLLHSLLSPHSRDGQLLKKSNLITHWDYLKPSNWCITNPFFKVIAITNFPLPITYL